MMHSSHSAQPGSIGFICLLHVDETQIAAEHISQAVEFKNVIITQFTGRDLGETTFFLQMSVECDRERQLIVLLQQHVIEKLVDTAGLSEAWPTQVPMITQVYRDPCWPACV
jgi:hypothetical protein